ncbi:MAG: hypothetical protein NXH72_03420 [Hyphomonadaceae bacterium]|nr:hypothetical protein [Hyphomonadaceae bacterium]
MGFLRLALALLVITLISPAGHAGTVHEVRFAQSGKVLVWQDGERVGQGADVIVNAPEVNAGNRLIGAGQLEPIGASRDQASNSLRLQVASNTGFEIISIDPVRTPKVRVVVAGIGDNAALKAGATSSEVLFQQATKSAVRSGSALSQAIALDIFWDGDVPPALLVRAKSS